MTNLILLTAASSTLFLLASHPLSMGFILLIQTLLISMITGNMTQNFWYSYIIFIIMVGGMLVLFIYMTSVASNEKFQFSNMMIMNLLTMMMFMVFNLSNTDLYTIINKNSEISLMNMNLNMETSMNKYLNFPSNLMMFFLIIYLLITLIAVVKITNIKYGPLRQKM